MANEFFAIIDSKIVLQDKFNTGTFSGGGTWTTAFLPMMEDDEYIENKYPDVVYYMIKYFKNKYNESK